MTSLYKYINLFAIVATTIISLPSCTEKAENSNQKKQTVIPPVKVTEDKIAQLQREALEGDSDAQYSLAYLYENGLGVPKNETKALELYKQAADQGHSAAQDNLDAISNLK